MAVNIKSPSPLFDRVVVREIIDNSQRFLDLKENDPKAYEKIFGKNLNLSDIDIIHTTEEMYGSGNSNVDTQKGLLSDIPSDLEKALLIAPPNSIIGTVVTPGFEYDSTPKIFYPMFPPHLSLPIKPGFATPNANKSPAAVMSSAVPKNASSPNDAKSVKLKLEKLGEPSGAKNTPVRVPLSTELLSDPCSSPPLKGTTSSSTTAGGSSVFESDL